MDDSIQKKRFGELTSKSSGIGNFYDTNVSHNVSRSMYSESEIPTPNEYLSAKNAIDTYSKNTNNIESGSIINDNSSAEDDFSADMISEIEVVLDGGVSSRNSFCFFF